MFLTYLKNSFPNFYHSFRLERPDVLELPIDIVIFESLVTFVLGEITGNSSHVDRVWTFLPPLYTAYFTFLPLFSWAPTDLKLAGVSDRALVMLGVQLLWSLRLSYNTWRRDLFKLSEEDYRWAILRAKLPGFLYTIFSFVFIAFIQHFLLFAQGLPAYAATLQPRKGLATSDLVLAALSIITVATEFVADNQQWTYQNFKRGTKLDNPWPLADCGWTELDAKRGFVAEGLWSVSRHPNFLCEQLFWLWSSLFPILGEPSKGSLTTSPISYWPYLPRRFSFFDLASHPTTTPWWPVASSFAYSMLFLSSTKFSESVTSEKYVAYAFYKQRVAMFNPITTYFKGIYLELTGAKKTVDNVVWASQRKDRFSKQE